MSSESSAVRRKPHAVLDTASRRWKALKIEKLLGLLPERRLRMLEIGCGVGGISHYFANHPELQCEVEAVDVVDLRRIKEGYHFTRVNSTALPFPDESFDIVLSNHVIEHVGNASSQAHHLLEIRRVLKPDGRGYLAVPNRWQVIEPHFRLAFLSWLPAPLRTPYLRLSRRGDIYDCEPFSVPRLESALKKAGFQFKNVCVPATRLTFEIERPGSMQARIAERTPDQILKAFKLVMPTLIYLIYR